MQNVETALENFNAALLVLEERLSVRLRNAGKAQAELEALQVEAAHMRSEISALKKQLSAGVAAQGKAEQQIDAAMKQLDQLMNGAGDNG